MTNKQTKQNDERKDKRHARAASFLFLLLIIILNFRVFFFLRENFQVPNFISYNRMKITSKTFKNIERKIVNRQKLIKQKPICIKKILLKGGQAFEDFQLRELKKILK